MLKGVWRRIRREEQGFTLVELLVVIVILGVLAGIGIPTYKGFIQRSYEAATLAELQAISMAVKFYFVENDDDSDFEISKLVRYLGEDLSIPDEDKPNEGEFLDKFSLTYDGESAFVTAEPTAETKDRKPANVYIKPSGDFHRGDIEITQ